MRGLAALPIAALLAGCAADSRPVVHGPNADADGGEGPTPISRVAPRPPAQAVERGVDAVCAMTFDINVDGATENICGVCNTSRIGDDALTRSLEQQFLAVVTQAISEWTYTTGEFYSNAHNTMTLSLSGRSRSPAAPEPIVCSGGEG